MKKFKFIINGSSYEVSVLGVEKDIAEIEVNGTPFQVEVQKAEKDSPLIAKAAGKVEPVPVPEHNVFVHAIKAPLPGNIFKIMVEEGQMVKRGDVLLIMESMKMENNILASEDGIVKNIHVQVGQQVMQDDIMIDFEGHLEIQAVSAAVKPEKKKEEPVKAPTIVGKNTVKTPIPGSVFKIVVTEGQKVKRGDVLLVLESMKMENNILAEQDGTVKKIHVVSGQSVMQDDPLFDLE